MLDPDAIAFAPAPAAPGLAARLAERWRYWRERRRWVGEMTDAGALGHLDDILYDVGITRAELDVLIDGPADLGRQLETFAAMAQIDLRLLDPAVLREAMWKCTRCQCRVPCKRWLRTGIWRDGGDMRCPNAALFRH